MKIGFFLIEPWQEVVIKDALKDNELLIFSESPNMGLIEKIKDAEILASKAKFVELKLDKEVLEKMPNLKYICTMSTGFDHIDLDYCRQRGILVSNVPVYGDNSLAEYVFSLILFLAKKISLSLKSITKEPFKESDFTGLDLKGKIMGVIGTGKIGLNVIRIAKGFEMQVLAYDVMPNADASDKLGFLYVRDLKELLKKSDIVTVHAPYNKNTYHLLNEDNLCFLKKGSMLINTARGELIDNQALLKFIKNGTIAFLGLDVFEGEEQSDFKWKIKGLLKNDDVIFTPHNASNTQEANKRLLESTLDNIINFIRGTPKNLVNQH